MSSLTSYRSKVLKDIIPEELEDVKGNRVVCFHETPFVNGYIQS